MEFTFLGTSAGTPSRARNVTALALRHGAPKSWYLIDCGEGTQHQLLRTPYTLHGLRAVFITHVHGDHCFGLPGLLSSASLAGRLDPLPIIAPAPLRSFIEAALAASDTALKFPLPFIETGDPGFAWSDPAFDVTTVALSHRAPCTAFVFTERNLERKLLTGRLEAAGIEAGPDWGRLQRGEDVALQDGRVLRSADYTAVIRVPRRLIVAGDNDRPELLAEACAGAQVLVHEATYTQDVADRVGPAPMHSSAAMVARFAESAGLPHLVLTHFSPRYQYAGKGPLIEDIAAEARTHYGGALHLARDFATYRLNRDLSLSPLPEPERRSRGAPHL